MAKVIDLPSGKKLEITLAEFSKSKDLFQALMEEGKGLKMDPEAQVDVNFYKDLIFTAMSSKRVELALGECLKRCTYSGLKIDKDTFEPEEAREDYIGVVVNVGYENIRPFLKNLYAQFAALRKQIEVAQA